MASKVVDDILDKEDLTKKVPGRNLDRESKIRFKYLRTKTDRLKEIADRIAREKR